MCGADMMTIEFFLFGSFGMCCILCLKSKGVDVWGWGCYWLYHSSNNTFVFFWTLSAIKKCAYLHTVSLCFILPLHVTFLSIPLTLDSCCLQSFASSCVYFSLPLCQFKSVILSFQVLQATSGAVSSFSTSWPFLKASLTSSASSFRG